MIMLKRMSWHNTSMYHAWREEEGIEDFCGGARREETTRKTKT
jgi:hypothetical protein